MMNVIKAAATLAVLLALAILPPPSAAQKYPEKNVRLIVPFPSGASQILGILVSEKLTEALGQPVVVDFRAGAGGTIGAEVAARSPNDGYTLLLTSVSLAISPSIYKNLRFDPVRDFTAITQVAAVPNVMVVHPSVPAKSLKELIQVARAHPGKLSFGSGGVGSSNHLANELFKSIAKIDIVHVPYKGASIALTHILSGEIEMVVVTVPATIPFVTTGRLRGIAVLAPQRVPTLAGVPTTAEAGMPELVVITWYGLFAPAGVKPDIVNRLNAEMVRAMNTPEVKRLLAKVEVDPATSTPSEFAALLKAETEKWARVIREANIRVE
jgi:tripartite-type tricarboxylate transporter receptor subunit TctC